MQDDYLPLSTFPSSSSSSSSEAQDNDRHKRKWDSPPQHSGYETTGHRTRFEPRDGRGRGWRTERGGHGRGRGRGRGSFLPRDSNRDYSKTAKTSVPPPAARHNKLLRIQQLWYPKGFPHFATKDECTQYVQQLESVLSRQRGSNPDYDDMNQLVTILVDWPQIQRSILLPLLHQDSNEGRAPPNQDNGIIIDDPLIDDHKQLHKHPIPTIQSNLQHNIQRHHFQPLLLGHMGKLQCYQRMKQSHRLTHGIINNTLRYLFFHLKCGIFVKIHNNELAMFIPFANRDYQNIWWPGDDACVGHWFNREWYPRGAADYFAHKQSYMKRPERILPNARQWWCNGSLICNEENRQVWGDALLPALLDMLLEVCKSRHGLPNVAFFINKRDHPQLKKTPAVEPNDHCFDRRDVPLKREVHPYHSPICSFFSGPRFADFLFPTTDDWETATGRVFPRGSDLYAHTTRERLTQPIIQQIWTYKNDKNQTVLQLEALGQTLRLRRMPIVDSSMSSPSGPTSTSSSASSSWMQESHHLNTLLQHLTTEELQAFHQWKDNYYHNCCTYLNYNGLAIESHKPPLWSYPQDVHPSRAQQMLWKVVSLHRKVEATTTSSSSHLGYVYQFNNDPYLVLYRETWDALREVLKQLISPELLQQLELVITVEAAETILKPLKPQTTATVVGAVTTASATSATASSSSSSSTQKTTSPDDKAKHLSARTVPWSYKIPTLFFRGTATGGGTTIDNNQRLRAAYVSHEWMNHPQYARFNVTDGFPYLDAAITSWNMRDKKLCGQPMTFIRPNELPFGLGQFLPVAAQGGYKYLLYISGHSASARYSYLMTLGSVIFKVKADPETCDAPDLWFFSLLKPYVDHIPVEADLSDLATQIEWAKTHDAECQQIALNCKELYDRFLSKEGILDYCQVLLQSFDHPRTASSSGGQGQSVVI